jgi:hypothetical protein
MPNNITARKDGEWLVIFTVPDVCKTPVGSAIVPIPYPTIAKLGDAVKEVKNIRANGAPWSPLPAIFPPHSTQKPVLKKV